MIVIINEQHKLLPEQEEILRSMGEYVTYLVPLQGITKQEIMTKAQELENETVVFVSPIPLLLAKVVATSQQAVYIFHNDNRQKQEKNGKIITIISKGNWELIQVK